MSSDTPIDDEAQLEEQAQTEGTTPDEVGEALSGQKKDYLALIKQEWAAFFRLLPFLWPHDVGTVKLRIAGALFCLLLAKMMAVYIPLIFRDMVDALSIEDDKLLAIPVGLILAYGLVKILGVVFQEAREWLFVRAAQRSIRLVALRVFNHLHDLDLSFHLTRRTGALNRHIDRGIKGIDFLLQSLLFHVLPTLVEIFLVFMIMWGIFNLWYALVLLLTISGYIVFTFGITEWRLRYRRLMNSKDAQANDHAIDSLLNYETVKYFNNEEHESRRYDETMQDYEQAAVMNTLSLSAVNIGQILIISMGLVIILMMGAHGIVHSTHTVGDFVLIGAYMLQLYAPLSYLGFIYRQLRQSLHDMTEMFSLLDVEGGIEDRAGALDLPDGPRAIQFQNVGFSYDSERPILKNISFGVEGGQKLAIVGASGSGKSSIVRLLFRFYDPQQGHIMIDGYDIRNVSQYSLRQTVGIVPQETVLFNDSIYYNIAYGRPDALPSDVEAAARAASVHESIMQLPSGYQTVVGERGLKLSGGEKQRIGIARTILKMPDILVFDEATSSLDSVTEGEIQKSLDEISKDHTTITIAHRLSTVVNADEILVLEGGEIVEQGSHKDLLAKKGAYGKLWAEQLKADKKPPKEEGPEEEK